MSALPLVICDTETTGLSPSEHRIIEVAYAKVTPGGWGDFTIRSHRFDLTPAAYRAGEARAYQVNGYQPGHPDWAGVPVIDTEAAKAQWRAIERDLTDVILVNQNVSFDAKFLLSEFDRHNNGIAGEAPWHTHKWEVMTFSKLHMKAAGQKGWALHKTYELLKGPKLPEHRAEADVLRAVWVLAEGMIKFPKVWEGVEFDCEGAKGAVERWAKTRTA